MHSFILMLGLLQAAGLSPARGNGRVNGHQVEVGVLDGASPAALEESIKAALRGQFTVVSLGEGPARTLLVADLQSSQCPACAPLSGESLERTYAFTFLTLPDGRALGFGSSAGALAAHSRAPAGAATYGGLAVDSESAFTFGRAHVDTKIARWPKADASGMTRLVAELAADGYAQIAGESGGELSAFATYSAWRRGNTVVSVATLIPSESHESEVIINEIDAP